MLYAEILAGGSGTRMTGAAMPKQFIKLGELPIIIHTVERFVAYGRFDAIIICAPAEWTDYTSALMAEYFHNHSDIIVVPGGKNRNTSVMCGVEYIKQHFGIKPDDIIVTHDAVRPFIDNRILSENERAAAECGAANTVMPTYDTLVESEDGLVAGATPYRSRFFRVQTPQSFKLNTLYALLASLTSEEAEKYTDTAAIFSAYGKTVKLVRGSDMNIKLTTPFDISLARVIYENIKAGNKNEQ